MYDFVVINDDVLRASDELVAYIRSLSEDATENVGTSSAL
jgi:hypothetical protein